MDAAPLIEEGRKAIETVAPAPRDRFPVLMSCACFALVLLILWRTEARADAQTATLQVMAREMGAQTEALTTIKAWCCTVAPVAPARNAVFRERAP